MKALKLMIAVLMAASVSVKAADSPRGVKVLADRMDVVYLKVSPDLVGGVLTVLDQNGNIVFDMRIGSKRILVDFINERAGNYVIHIARCDRVEELKYHRTMKV